MTLERRSLEVEIRAPAEGEDVLEQDGLPRRFWARVVNYGVLDNYRTLFREGCFDGGLERRLPRLMYGHGGWENPLALVGKAIESRSVRGADGGLDVRFELDDFEFVPVARQIAYQLKNATLDRFSVGFIRKRDTRAPAKGGTWIDEGELAEVSVLPEGSVPGTRVLSFRSGQEGEGEAPRVIPVDDAARIITRFSLGELSLTQALLAVVEDSAPGESAEEEETPDESTPDGGDDTGDDDGDQTGDPPDPAAAGGDTPGEVVEDATGENTTFVDEEADSILLEVDEVLAGRGPVIEQRRDFSQVQRDKAADTGAAMEDGSYPIKTRADLANAIQSIGRAKNRAAVMAHIKKRAAALGMTKMLPKEWQ